MTFDIYVLRLYGPYSTCFYYRSYMKRNSRLEPCWVDDIKKATVWTNKQHAILALRSLIKRKSLTDAGIKDLTICRFTAVYQGEEETGDKKWRPFKKYEN